MADALIPGYSLPEHLKSAKQIIPIDIDQVFENNFYKNADEVFAYTQTPEGKTAWANGGADYVRPWHPVLIKEYNLDFIPNYITFTLFSLKLLHQYTKYYGVEYQNSFGYVKTTALDKQYGEILSENTSPGPTSYFPFYQFNGGISSCETTFAIWPNNSSVRPLEMHSNGIREPYINLQVSGRKLSLFTRMDNYDHTSNSNDAKVIWLFYRARYIKLQGIVSIF